MGLLMAVTDYCSPNDRIFLAVAQISALSFKVFSPWKSLRVAADSYARHFEYLLQRNGEIGTAKWLKRQAETANSLVEYEACTNELDRRQGHDQWKQERESIEPSYKPQLIEDKIHMLRDAATSGDRKEMAVVLQTALDRHLGGMDNVRLYKHSWFGTKHLVDDYINVAVQTIDSLVNSTIDSADDKTEIRESLDTLQAALNQHGRTALCLSGGALLGMKHIGIAKCLWECNLLPEIISGTSAGSIVAAIVCSSTDEEMFYTLEHFPKSNLAVFDPSGTKMPGWCANRLSTYWYTGRFFDPEFLRVVIKEWLKELTFREAYNKTHRVLNICVSKAHSAEPQILNYITAPDVLIWSAVCASCAVPGVFPEATIYVKDPITRKSKAWMEHAVSETFVDGSLDHDIPMRKLQEMFNVSWFMTSQVNPHVRPFLTREEEFTGAQPKLPWPTDGYLAILKHAVHDVLTHSAQILADLNFPPPMWRWAAVLNQQYTGNLNIFPTIRWLEMASMVSNPTPAYMRAATLDGERATWPKICRIKNTVAIELALQRAIRDMNERLHFSPEAMAAREQTRASRTGVRRGRGSSQPDFLSTRSLSRDSYPDDHNATTVTKTSSASSLLHRRNRSLGHLDFSAIPDKPARLQAPKQPMVSPYQAGYGEKSLSMTMSPSTTRS